MSLNGLANIRASHRLSHCTNTQTQDSLTSVIGTGTGVSHLAMTGKPNRTIKETTNKRFGLCVGLSFFSLILGYVL